MNLVMTSMVALLAYVAACIAYVYRFRGRSCCSTPACCSWFLRPSWPC